VVIEQNILQVIEDLLDLIKQDVAPASQDQWYYVRNHPAPSGVTPVQGPRKAWRWNPAMARAAGLDDDEIDQHLKTEVIEIEEDSAEEEKKFDEALREGEIEEEIGPIEVTLREPVEAETVPEEIGDDKKYWDRVSTIAEKSDQSTKTIRAFLDDPDRKEEILAYSDEDFKDPFIFSGIQLQVALEDPKSPESKRMVQLEKYFGSDVLSERTRQAARMWQVEHGFDVSEQPPQLRIESHWANDEELTPHVRRSVLEALINSRYPNNDNVSIPIHHIKQIKNIILQDVLREKQRGVDL